jgi:Tfp pilus assembly protein PilF
MTQQFDELVREADEFAQQGEWQLAFERLSRAHEVHPNDAGVLTGLGKCMLHWQGPQEALPFFQQAIIRVPDSTDAHNNLGLVQTLTGELNAAEGSYQMAVTLDPDNAQAWKNLAWLYLLQDDRVGEGVNILAAVIGSNPNDADAWFMFGRCYQEIGDLTSARDSFQRTLALQPDHSQAQEALDQLASPISQPRLTPDITRIARPEHVQKLASLKSLKDLRTKPALGEIKANGVNFYGPPDYVTEVRLGVPARALSKSGLAVKVSLRLDPADLAAGAQSPAVFIFANPHYTPELSTAVEQCLQAGKRVIIDLDYDYHHFPPKTTGYNIVGPGNPETLRALETLLGKVDLLTVPSPALAEQYKKYASRVEVVPHAWARSDILWEKPAPKRNTINLGVISLHTMPQDARIIKNGIQRILGETPEALLVIGGDMSLNEAFSSIPDDRKMYVPSGLVKDYPYLLANFDILLLPLEENPFNSSRPDLPLIEAGVRRIPWVATPIPAFTEWSEGGLLVEKRAGWYTQIRKLLKDADLRRQLGEAGRAKAEKRESDVVVKRWQEVLKIG